MKKFCVSLREHKGDTIDFEKKKTMPITKTKTKITSRCNRMLHLQKKIYKKFTKDKNH